jgi:hypothetical protein
VVSVHVPVTLLIVFLRHYNESYLYICTISIVTSWISIEFYRDVCTESRLTNLILVSIGPPGVTPTCYEVI